MQTSEDHSHLEQSIPSTNLHWAENADLESRSDLSDLVCFSHLRWDFVYQRPQHLLSRCAQSSRVFFVEEPLTSPDDSSCYLDISRRKEGVWVVVPHLPDGCEEEKAIALQQCLLDHLFAEAEIQAPILWYYTPMAVPFTYHLNASAVIYDCMDELSAFKGAHPELQTREAQLFKLADLVFTGGRSLYEVKRHQHSSVHAFPSSIDVTHFAQARSVEEPVDQASIPHPRLGFYGVIDERMDLALLGGIAKAKPNWHLVIIGPVVKIDPASLPNHPNIHYLGSKSYQQLPSYLAGWDVALLLFARNESTRFISPTKTPEYLAAGKPVVSTSIRDVVRPYGEEKLVHIADTTVEFVSAIERALEQNQTDAEWLNRVDAFLAQTSWDLTWQAMNDLIETVIATRPESTPDNISQQQSSVTARSTKTKQPVTANVKKPAS